MALKIINLNPFVSREVFLAARGAFPNHADRLRHVPSHSTVVQTQLRLRADGHFAVRQKKARDAKI
jgi:hypothetical protein